MDWDGPGKHSQSAQVDAVDAVQQHQFALLSSSDQRGGPPGRVSIRQGVPLLEEVPRSHILPHTHTHTQRGNACHLVYPVVHWQRGRGERRTEVCVQGLQVHLRSIIHTLWTLTGFTLIWKCMGVTDFVQSYNISTMTQYLSKGLCHDLK